MAPTPALYPTWLLASPLKLAVQHQRAQYQGPLTLLSGPQRLEAGWCEAGDCALRDYFWPVTTSQVCCGFTARGATARVAPVILPMPARNGICMGCLRRHWVRRVR